MGRQRYWADAIDALEDRYAGTRRPAAAIRSARVVLAAAPGKRQRGSVRRQGANRAEFVSEKPSHNSPSRGVVTVKTGQALPQPADQSGASWL